MSNKNNRRGMSMKTKWIITGVLCVLAVLTVIVVAADGCFDFKPGSVKSNNKDVVESAAPADEKDTSKSGDTHTVFVTAGNGGATDPNGSVSVEDYGSVTITITPYDGYEIQSVTVDGQDKGAVESYTLSNVTEDHSIIATFVKKVVPTPTPTPAQATPEPDDDDDD